MDKLMFLLYGLLVRLGDVFVYIMSFFNVKMRLLYLGRKQTLQKIAGFSHKEHKKTIWIHCASLGEFEQGRPLIEYVRKYRDDTFIVLSFFSPSGYEIMKNYDKVDIVMYLPSDLPNHNSSLINAIKPDIFVLVKYEFWWNLIQQLLAQKVKVYLISGVFREKDYFFNTLFKPFQRLLSGFTQIFVQDELSSEILKERGLFNCTVAGDTRIDRVIQRSASPEIPDRILSYCNTKKVIVYGSVWMTDIPVIREILQTKGDYIHILAPHNISKENIRNIIDKFSFSFDLYSEGQWSRQRLIIDNIGMLGNLYKLADYAYIGGGFQQGIHNILEPAVFGIPVFFGPNHGKFNEAVYMVANKMAFEITGSYNLLEKIEELESSEADYLEIRHKLFQYFESNKGATQKIAEALLVDLN